jgi:hypothetical protein
MEFEAINACKSPKYANSSHMSDGRLRRCSVRVHMSESLTDECRLQRFQNDVDAQLNAMKQILMPPAREAPQNRSSCASLQRLAEARRDA